VLRLGRTRPLFVPFFMPSASGPPGSLRSISFKFADLSSGYFSADGRVFATPHLRLPDGLPDGCVPLAAPDNHDALTLFFARSSLVAIASSQSLLQLPTLRLSPDRHGTCPKVQVYDKINNNELPPHEAFYNRLKIKILQMKNIICVSMLGMITT
jgi:hypothetical protein